MKRLLIAVALGLASLAIGGGARAQLYDMIGDFSHASDPNGVWSFGQSLVRNGPFTLYTLNSSADILAHQLESWSNGSLPAIGLNALSSDISVSLATVPAESMYIHPGPTGQYSIVEFTAPVGGMYTITGSYTGADRSPTTTDDWITTESGGAFTDLFEVNVNDFGIPHPFDLTTKLAKGDSLRFSVGAGTNGN